MCKIAYQRIDFRPQGNWHWIYDNNRETLTLNMGDFVVDIAYKRTMLILQFDQAVFFTIKDVACYMEFFEDPTFEQYSPAFRCKLILHILAVQLFHKPIMPKNWLFATYSKQYRLCESNPVTLISSALKEAKMYLVLENKDDFILCILIEKSHALTPSRTFKQFQVVKVSHDKIAAKKQ